MVGTEQARESKRRAVSIASLQIRRSEAKKCPPVLWNSRSKVSIRSKVHRQMCVTFSDFFAFSVFFLVYFRLLSDSGGSCVRCVCFLPCLKIKQTALFL
jgi:hypothetical protein